MSFNRTVFKEFHNSFKDILKSQKMMYVPMECRFTIYSLFLDIHNLFKDIHNVFMDILNSFMDILQ